MNEMRPPALTVALVNGLPMLGEVNVTLKLLVAVPAELVTVMAPLAGNELGATARIEICEVVEKETASTPANFTEEIPMKFVPAMITGCWGPRRRRSALVIVGNGSTRPAKELGKLTVSARVARAGKIRRKKTKKNGGLMAGKR